MEPSERFLQIADMIAEGEDVDLGALLDAGELTAGEVRALRSLDLLHRVQVGEIPFDGPEPASPTSRFEPLDTVVRRPNIVLFRAKDRLLSKTVMLKKVTRDPRAARDEFNTYIQKLGRLVRERPPGLAHVLETNPVNPDHGIPGVFIVMEAHDPVHPFVPAGTLAPIPTAALARALRELPRAIQQLVSMGLAPGPLDLQTTALVQGRQLICYDFADPPAGTASGEPALNGVRQLLHVLASKCKESVSDGARSRATEELIHLLEAKSDAAGSHSPQVAGAAFDAWIADLDTWLQTPSGRVLSPKGPFGAGGIRAWLADWMNR